MIKLLLQKRKVMAYIIQKFLIASLKTLYMISFDGQRFNQKEYSYSFFNIFLDHFLTVIAQILALYARKNTQIIWYYSLRCFSP